jgi:tetratricopeptide (TPR) repeat protein
MRAPAEIVVSRPDQEKMSDPAWVHQQANDLFQKGIAQINEGRFDEGLRTIQQTIQFEPQVPDWHMSYGSLLFAKAGILYKAHREEESVLLAKEAEKELLCALDLFKGDQYNIPKSQCYFFLGELSYFIYKDKQAAKRFYEESLKTYADNQEAKEALKTCE